MTVKLGPFARGAYGFNVDFTINESDGTAKDLTGLTGTIKAWKPGASTVSISSSLTTLSATLGSARWAVASSAFQELIENPGYNARIELSSSGYLEPTEIFQIEVNEAAPSS